MSDKFFVTGFWGFCAVLAWIFWFLTIVDHNPSADTRYNYVFWSIALATYSAVGIAYFEHKIEDWFQLIIVGGAGVGCALYAYNAGYADGQKITNYLHALWWGIVGMGTLGFAALATVSYGAAIREASDNQEQKRRQKQEEDEFNAQFNNVGEDEEKFDYDEAAFSGGGSDQPNAPRGFDKRHPDDAKLWAVVDDPAANANERVTAMQKIAEREAKRTGRTTSKRSGATGRTVAKGKS